MDTLTVTLTAHGVRIDLRDFDGTPMHDDVWRLLQRRSWPTVSRAVSGSIPVAFV